MKTAKGTIMKNTKGYEKLIKHLQSKNARCLWTVAGFCQIGSDGTEISGWATDKDLYIVHNYGKDGFEVYKPVTSENNVDQTLQAIK